MKVHRWDAERDGPPTEEAVSRRLETLGYRIRQYVYPPGMRFPPHYHEVPKLDAVVSGQMEIAAQGERIVIGPGDAVEMPRGIIHSARVVSSEPTLSLDGTLRGG